MERIIGRVSKRFIKQSLFRYKKVKKILNSIWFSIMKCMVFNVLCIKSMKLHLNESYFIEFKLYICILHS